MNRLTWSVAVCSLLLLAGCEQTEQAQTARSAPSVHLVEVTRATLEPVSIHRTRTGTLRAERVVNIHAREAGEIRSLPFYPGDSVAQGAVLVELDDVLLRAELGRARAALSEAQQNLERLRQLTGRNLVSHEDLLRRETQARVARADVDILETRLAYTRIEAPFEGVISERLVEPGGVVERYDHLLTLIDPTQLIAQVSLSELVLAQLSVGDPVSVSIDALGGESVPAHVSRIYPQVDPVTRRGELEIRLASPPARAKPGQLIRVKLATADKPRLMLPFGALLFEEQPFVYVVNREGSVERRTLVTGIRLGDQIEILDGIEPGDRIVVRGFLGLTPGKAVSVVNAEPAS
ncbi:efflux RND transporter periplasmic adaptor subunit [Marinobacterium litorale]|uniref:efflux RND transporter periplasmic adaptor subunit n=1 Tax=Marinobacterium litorale TaxID=404770 RepID=UPI000488A626|nr:efflux RND transporter periplasmic adaptor subunit [Marinobacterium litorale]